MTLPEPGKMEPRIVQKLRTKYSSQLKRALDRVDHANGMLAALKVECGHPALQVHREWWGVWAHCPDCHAGRDDLEEAGIGPVQLEVMRREKEVRAVEGGAP